MTTVDLLGKVDLLGRASSIALARMYVREVLLEAGYRVVDDVLLLVGEVVANAVKHSYSGRQARGVMQLLVYRNDRTVRVEVVDEGSPNTIPQIPAQVDPLSENGRGLWLVRELSSAWGWQQDEAGRTVWFEIAP
ncbi:ATP-binding protein [Sphaerisporangium sp. NPDC051017]|uniref:ATP-binding protein n=1 Tax=Sphaerisporangium sp. NPDC051017 TaxID=3154636 RepID=UPI0034442297